VEKSLPSRFYRDVPQEALDRLISFRRKYPYRTQVIDGIEWRFIDTLQGDRALLVLPGATTVAEISFQTLEHLAQSRRVIAPDYPPLDKLQPLFAGLLTLLDTLHVKEFDLLGGSYGGWMAQSLLLDASERIGKVVVSAVGLPNPENSRQLARMMRWMRWMPTFLLKALINRSFARLDSSEASQDSDTALLWAMVREVMTTRVTRADILALLTRLIDQTDNFPFDEDPLHGWPGQMLLIFGSEDPATPADRREAMQRRYPQAEVVVFEGDGHAMAITRQEEYFAALDSFLGERSLQEER